VYSPQTDARMPSEGLVAAILIVYPSGRGRGPVAD
jgi:hypothetical protein